MSAIWQSQTPAVCSSCFGTMTVCTSLSSRRVPWTGAPEWPPVHEAIPSETGGGGYVFLGSGGGLPPAVRPPPAITARMPAGGAAPPRPVIGIEHSAIPPSSGPHAVTWPGTTGGDAKEIQRHPVAGLWILVKTLHQGFTGNRVRFSRSGGQRELVRSKDNRATVRSLERASTRTSSFPRL